jgi:alkylation response protein AidB-like acyl-CoA dehydrogenase
VPADFPLSVPPPPRRPAAAVRLRRRFRRFLAAELQGLGAFDRSASWDGFDPAFSRRMGEAGFIGLALPREWGGHGRPVLERYVVCEEALVAGAPVGFHWFADRQSGPLIARYGTDAQKRAILPALCRGELCFCIGMSEPGAGSDLAALRTEARPVDGGFVANGTKLWTTNAHRAHYMIALLRTTPRGEADGRHAGFSQFLVDLKSPGIRIRPVRDLYGREHFNEVNFTDCFLPADSVIGRVGEGWAQVTAELVTLRTLSLGVAAQLAAGEDPQLAAAVVKDLGARFEQSLPSLAQDLVAVTPTLDAGADEFRRVLASLMLVVPSFSLRGGSVEVLRGIIARGLGLRAGGGERDGGR